MKFTIFKLTFSGNLRALYLSLLTENAGILIFEVMKLLQFSLFKNKVLLCLSIRIHVQVAFVTQTNL